jgi:hypothetical protein
MAARALLALLSPQPASACAVCFGRSAGQEGLISGLTWGLFILIGFTMLALGSIAVTIVRIEKARAAKEKLS